VGALTSVVDRDGIRVRYQTDDVGRQTQTSYFYCARYRNGSKSFNSRSWWSVQSPGSPACAAGFFVSAEL
jgi:hypothetical protein